MRIIVQIETVNFPSVIIIDINSFKYTLQDTSTIRQTINLPTYLKAKRLEGYYSQERIDYLLITMQGNICYLPLCIN